MTNEQKYKTAEERIKAFDYFCKGQGYRCNHCEIAKKRLSISIRSECVVYWLALEAEEEKLEPCPFCGGTTEVITDKQGYYGVSCIHCDYTSERYEQSIYAIAAHNRVFRAVEAIKKGVK